MKANCMHAIWQQIKSKWHAAICQQTAHMQVTSKQQLHNSGIGEQTVCMQYGSKSKASGMLPYVSKLHTCKLSAKQPATLLLLNYMYAQCVQGCAIVLLLF